MAYQGEYFVDRYGATAAERTPPDRARCCRWASRSAAGTDATRVASYNPWVCAVLAGHGQDGRRHALYPEANRLDRERGAAAVHAGQRVVLRRGGQEGGDRSPGQLADLAVLSADYFSVPEERDQGDRVGADGGGRQGRVRRRRRSPGSPRRRCRSCPTGRRSRRTAATIRSGSTRRVSPRPCLRPRHARPVAPRPRPDSAGQAGAVVGWPGLRVLCVLSRVSEEVFGRPISYRCDLTLDGASRDRLPHTLRLTFARRRGGMAVTILRFNQAGVSPSPITGDDTPLFKVDGPGTRGMHASRASIRVWIVVLTMSPAVFSIPRSAGQEPASVRSPSDPEPAAGSDGSTDAPAPSGPARTPGTGQPGDGGLQSREVQAAPLRRGLQLPQGPQPTDRLARRPEVHPPGRAGRLLPVTRRYGSSPLRVRSEPVLWERARQ